MTRLASLLLAALPSGGAHGAEFSFPPGLIEKSGEVPYPGADDVFIPSKWCTDKNGVKNGPWWGWDPKTKSIVFRVSTDKGEPHGLYREYHPNGSIAEEGKLEHGKRIGQWVTHKEDGTVVSVENY